MVSKVSSLETALTLCLSLMIIVTIIGNILVCLSVILVRKLRSPSNYLLVSLAISDLCVAVLVMPLALNLEVKGYWDLGETLCDMWVSFDVTSCTASILNLCMISVDRYLTITQPLTYGVKRTTKRMTAFIAIVWISSCLISVPPLLVLGNEHGLSERPTCQVSQHIVYQLYATLGAFYIPLGVMIILYAKIYGAAKSVVDAELRSLGHTNDRLVLNNNNNNNSDHNLNSTHPQSKNTIYNNNHHHDHHHYQQQHQDEPHARRFPALKPLLKSSASVNYDCNQLSESTLSDSECQQSNQIDHHLIVYDNNPQQSRDCSAECFMETDYCKLKSSPIKSSPTVATTPKLTIPLGDLINCGETRIISDKTPKISFNSNNNNNDTFNNNHLNLKNSDSHHQQHCNCSILSPYTKKDRESISFSSNSHPRRSIMTSIPSGQTVYPCSIKPPHNPIVNYKKSSSIHSNSIASHFGSFRKSFSDRFSFHSTGHGRTSTDGLKRRTSSMLKERKASITLGVIMTAFTACWLPFFILALLRPFSKTFNEIPNWISSLCYWLGLTNSMLNPIIYVTFHHDFRKAFRYLLCLQCSSMDFRLRERAYQSQYGNIIHSSDHHHNHQQQSDLFQSNQLSPSPSTSLLTSHSKLLLDQFPSSHHQPESQSIFKRSESNNDEDKTVISHQHSDLTSDGTLAPKRNLIPANNSFSSSPSLLHYDHQQPLTFNIDHEFTSSHHEDSYQHTTS